MRNAVKTRHSFANKLSIILERHCKTHMRMKIKLKIWIITDARRKTDLKYFKLNFPGQMKTVRITAEESTRIKRNWIHTDGKIRILMQL